MENHPQYEQPEWSPDAYDSEAQQANFFEGADTAFRAAASEIPIDDSDEIMQQDGTVSKFETEVQKASQIAASSLESEEKTTALAATANSISGLYDTYKGASDDAVEGVGKASSSLAGIGALETTSDANETQAQIEAGVKQVAAQASELLYDFTDGAVPKSLGDNVAELSKLVSELPTDSSALADIEEVLLKLRGSELRKTHNQYVVGLQQVHSHLTRQVQNIQAEVARLAA